MIIHSKPKGNIPAEGSHSQKRESQFKNQWKICFTNFQRHFALIKDQNNEKLNEEQKQVKMFQEDILKRSENKTVFKKVQNWLKKEKINSKKTFFKAIQNQDEELVQFVYASLYVFLEQKYYRKVISKIYEHKSIQQNEELLRKFLIANNGEHFPQPVQNFNLQSSFFQDHKDIDYSKNNCKNEHDLQEQQYYEKQSSFLEKKENIMEEENQVKIELEEEQKINFSGKKNNNNSCNNNESNSNNNNNKQQQLNNSRYSNNKRGKKGQQKHLKQLIDKLTEESKKNGQNYTIVQEQGDYYFKYKINANKKGTYELKIPITLETLMQLDQDSAQNSFISEGQSQNQQSGNGIPQSSFLNSINNTNNNINNNNNNNLDQNSNDNLQQKGLFLGNSFNSKKNIQYKVKVHQKEQNTIEKIYNQEDIENYSLINFPKKEEKSYLLSEVQLQPSQQLSLKQQSGMQFESFHLSCCSEQKENGENKFSENLSINNQSFQQQSKRRKSLKLNKSCINNISQSEKNKQIGSNYNKNEILLSSRPSSEISQENQIILTNKIQENPDELQKLDKSHLKQQLGPIQLQQQLSHSRNQQQLRSQSQTRKPSLEINININNINNNQQSYQFLQNDQINLTQIQQQQEQQQYQEASYFLEQSVINNNNSDNINIACQNCQTQQNILCNCNGQFNQQEMLNKDNISSIAPCDSRKWSEEFNF